MPSMQDEIQTLADAVFKLRGEFNEGDDNPDYRNHTLSASLLESFGSFLACVASDAATKEGEIDSGTLQGLINNLRDDIQAWSERGDKDRS